MNAIEAHPDLEVAGTAGNGKVALEQELCLTPDLVTMDVQMREVDGIQAVTDPLEEGPNDDKDEAGVL